MRHLTPQNAHEFFNGVYQGDLFTYSESLDLKMVYQQAHKAGWFIDYCLPESKAYEEHGCFTCRVMFRTK